MILVGGLLLFMFYVFVIFFIIYLGIWYVPPSPHQSPPKPLEAPNIAHRTDKEDPS